MSTPDGRIPAATEVIQPPRPSWAPAFFAFGLALAICGVFLDFMGPGWIYTVIGAVVALGAFRSMVTGAVRDFNSLPREQEVGAAALPADTIRVSRD